jgi:hypothetical protein
MRNATCKPRGQLCVLRTRPLRCLRGLRRTVGESAAHSGTACGPLTLSDMSSPRLTPGFHRGRYQALLWSTSRVCWGLGGFGTDPGNEFRRSFALHCSRE